MLVINPKYEALTTEIKQLEDIIARHNGREGRAEFNAMMKAHNVPVEDYIVYKALFDWRIAEPIEKLKSLKREYHNILPVWRVLNNITPDSKEEEFKIKVERAKQYPIENMYNGAVRKAGKRIAGKCPFHEDSSPSLFIFTDDNHFHCFGCGARGDAIEFYMKLHKCDFKEAVNNLC